MTAREQIDSWAASPNDELFVSFAFLKEPRTVQRMRAGDARALLERSICHATSVRTGEALGVPCVLIEGAGPRSGGLPYRVILAAVASFR